jgi:hypothetical protein
MAMARTDVHHERIRCSRGPGQRFAESGIDGLSNKVLDDGAVRR